MFSKDWMKYSEFNPAFMPDVLIIFHFGESDRFNVTGSKQVDARYLTAAISSQLASTI